MINNKYIFLYSLSFLATQIVISCNTEKINLSPIDTSSIASSFSNAKISNSTTYTQRVDNIGYASEITNTSAMLPKFGNEKVNNEVEKFKFYLKEYIHGMEAGNTKGMERAYTQYEASYKTLQILKLKLSSDEAEILNRYLVRTKTNMSNLENNSTK